MKNNTELNQKARPLVLSLNFSLPAAALRGRQCVLMIFHEFKNYCLSSSTRRFWARPASESLAATGFDKPSPTELKRLWSIPALVK